MRRSNPWPAFVDLFAALLIASFGGLMLLSAAYQHRVEHEVTDSQMRQAADAIHRRLRLAVARQPKLGTRIRDCGDDTCIDLYIHFLRNQASITSPAEQAALRELGLDLRSGLDQLADGERRDVELIVEGHADRSQVVSMPNPREAFLYNWNLSAKRASAVVYEFRQINLSVPAYKIVAIGYADSQPLCEQPTADCDEQNRRTTLRLRIDTRSLENRLKKPQSQ
jgi:outer membrane protein OmpA-like peptidoglycan-associated protein